MQGILNILKPPGMTSHDVVAVTRRLLNMKAVGHTGTLDPEAAGVLPVCLGRATKIIDLMNDHQKEYIAEMTLGSNTDTLDATGNLVRQRPVTADADAVRAVLPEYVGSIKQVPPMFSAIKIDGKSAYTYAREGQTVKIPVRTVMIHELQYLGQGREPHRHLIRVRCGKGTYIRTLLQEIGEQLGCGAHMSMLIRSQSGGFVLRDAVTLEQLRQAREGGRIADHIIPVDRALDHLPKAMITPKDRFHVTHGNALPKERIVNHTQLSGHEPHMLVYCGDELLVIGQWRQGDMDGGLLLQPRIMLIEPEGR